MTEETLELTELHFNSGLNISLSDMRSGLARSQRVVNRVMQSNQEIEPLLIRMKDKHFIVLGQNINIKVKIQNSLLKDMNNQLVLLNNLGGRFNTDLSTAINKKVKLTIEEVTGIRLELGAELLKPLTEYASLSDKIQKLNQLVLDTALLVENTLESSIQNYKET
jgi:hypothetical protein